MNGFYHIFIQNDWQSNNAWCLVIHIYGFNCIFVWIAWHVIHCWGLIRIRVWRTVPIHNIVIQLSLSLFCCFFFNQFWSTILTQCYTLLNIPDGPESISSNIQAFSSVPKTVLKFNSVLNVKTTPESTFVSGDQFQFTTLSYNCHCHFLFQPILINNINPMSLN